MLDVESIGESAAYVAGESTYREIPRDWVLRQVERFSGEYEVIAARDFAMKLTTR